MTWACLGGCYGRLSSPNFVMSTPKLHGEEKFSEIFRVVQLKPLWRATNWYYGNKGAGPTERLSADWLSHVSLNSLAYHAGERRKQEVSCLFVDIMFEWMAPVVLYVAR